MEETNIAPAVVGIIAEVASVDASRVSMDMTLMGKDLGMDSLAMLRLIVKLERRFPKRVTVDTIADVGIGTVAELVGRIEGCEAPDER